MRFSIVIPTYIPGTRVISTIESILSQTTSDYEMLIQDGSPDEEVEELISQKYSDNKAISIFHESDSGIYDAMNKAVLKATGEYCVFMGAGDTFHDREVLADIEKAINSGKEDIIYGYWIEIKDDTETTVIRKLNWKYIVKFSSVNHQSIFARTELLKEYPFDLSYSILADQDWLLKMKKQHRSMRFVNRPIAYFPLDGISATNIETSIKEQNEIHGKYYPFWKTVRYTWRKMAGKD